MVSIPASLCPELVVAGPDAGALPGRSRGARVMFPGRATLNFSSPSWRMKSNIPVAVISEFGSPAWVVVIDTRALPAAAVLAMVLATTWTGPGPEHDAKVRATTAVRIRARA